ncbi:MAG: hypothetical protein NTY76_04715 [Candidatus Omnitrophica bacterium]|nr:hypothetical protein [Candidatus Omnitrophota bacterium]
MNPKARLWIGATLLIVILINYVLIGVPLMSKSHSIQGKAKAILIKQAKSTGLFNNSDDEYLLDIFRKEKSSIDTKITILNAVAATLAFFAASWTVFGLIFKRK